mmetsp:Transcript_39209/g.101433  ORF Transcript_39209/g.101433 Transcript_39209/m.101433 type:complete len:205 (-) Transcript_39209:130-744(-)
MVPPTLRSTVASAASCGLTMRWRSDSKRPYSWRNFSYSWATDLLRCAPSWSTRERSSVILRRASSTSACTWRSWTAVSSSPRRRSSRILSTSRCFSAMNCCQTDNFSSSKAWRARLMSLRCCFSSISVFFSQPTKYRRRSLTISSKSGSRSSSPASTPGTTGAPPKAPVPKEPVPMGPTPVPSPPVPGGRLPPVGKGAAPTCGV